MASEYRLSPALTARLLGLLTIGLAVLVLAATWLVAALDLPRLVLPAGVLSGCALAAGTGVLLRRTSAVHLDEEGYRVRLVRGAGTTQARWSEVTEVATTVRAGTPCVVLHLRDGRRTIIPAGALDADREDFVRDLAGRLPRGRPPAAAGRP